MVELPQDRVGCGGGCTPLGAVIRCLGTGSAVSARPARASTTKSHRRMPTDADWLPTPELSGRCDWPSASRGIGGSFDAREDPGCAPSGWRPRSRRSTSAASDRKGWPTLVGASQTLSSGPRPQSRAWVRAIRRAPGGTAGGLSCRSSMYGGETAVVLWEAAGATPPRTPTLDLALSGSRKPTCGERSASPDGCTPLLPTYRQRH